MSSSLVYYQYGVVVGTCQAVSGSVEDVLPDHDHAGGGVDRLQRVGVNKGTAFEGVVNGPATLRGAVSGTGRLRTHAPGVDVPDALKEAPLAPGLGHIERDVNQRDRLSVGNPLTGDLDRDTLPLPGAETR